MYLKEYILSADMLQRLDRQLHLKQEFGQGGIDWFNRLPTDATREEFLNYYHQRVNVSFDEKTSLLSIRTIGFTSAFALRLNKAVLAESERFINELSHTIAREQMRYAQGQLDQAYGRLNEAKERLLTYQNKNGVLDPQAKAEAASKVIAEMEARQAQLETEQRNLLTYLNADTPQVQAIRNSIQSLKAQIETEKAKLAAPDGDKLNRKAAQFQEIRAHVEFNADLYKLSLTAVEKIRIEAVRKLKNLVVIVSPQQAEEAEYPQKLHILGTLLLCLSLVCGVTRLVLAIIEDHKD
jgi:capsular polysaccharide transport system permease protein